MNGNVTRTTGEWDVRAIYGASFLTGFAVLALEMIAFRQLSPYFGNTIFSFTSVITVVLAGLSIGYLVGGRYADRGPSYERFYQIIFFGGCASLVFYLSVPFILAGVEMFTSSMVWGTLFGSIIAFFVPAFVMGMVSPYAVKLAILSRGIDAAGATAGALSAFSTVGSILGSALTGFVLIPNSSLTTLVSVVSLGVVVLGAGGWIFYRSAARVTIASVAVLLCALGALYAHSVSGETVKIPFDGTIVHQEEGVYQTITVLDMFYRGVPTRALVLDRGLSSGINLTTNRLVFEYGRFQQLHALYAQEPNRVLYLGGGSASLGQVLHETDPDVEIVVVDIEPTLPAIARTHFRVPDSPRLLYEIADARVFLRRDTETYRYIFSDIFASIFSIPSHVMTEEFFALARARLAPDGVFMINIIGASDPEPPSVLLSTFNAINAVFPTTELFAVSDPQSTKLQNFVIVASNGPTVAERIEMIEQPVRRAMFENFNRWKVDLASYDLSQYRTYRDDRGSVEADMGVMLRRYERDVLHEVR